jgi:hypothetical protein
MNCWPKNYKIPSAIAHPIEKTLNLNSKWLVKRVQLSKNLSKVAWLDVETYKRWNSTPKTYCVLFMVLEKIETSGPWLKGKDMRAVKAIQECLQAQRVEHHQRGQWTWSSSSIIALNWWDWVTCIHGYWQTVGDCMLNDEFSTADSGSTGTEKRVLNSDLYWPPCNNCPT